MHWLSLPDVREAGVTEAGEKNMRHTSEAEQTDNVRYLLCFPADTQNSSPCCPYSVILNKHMTPRLCNQDAVCQVVQECVGLTRGQGNSHPALRHLAEWPLQILAACAPCKAAQLLHSCSLSHAEYVLVKVIYLALLSTALQLAGHTAELRSCMHTIASIQAKQNQL